ncbi:MAG: DUF839 domain-containing protein [Caldilineaceae bacterium]
MNAKHPFARLIAAVLAVAMLASLLPGIATAQDNNLPLSSLVAVTFVDGGGTEADNAADYVKSLVELYATDSLPEGMQFPLAAAATDNVRAIAGFGANVVISWLDPLTWDNAVDAPRFGANADFTAYFGEGWQEEDGMAPYFKGSGDAAWVWVNHEYVSNDLPSLTSAPSGQYVTLGNHLVSMGVLSSTITADEWSQEDLDTFIRQVKKQIGGTWMRIVKDPATGTWSVDRSAPNVRYDATSNTLTYVSGMSLSAADVHDATGEALPEGVVSGIMGDCSGAVTPWGTVISAEENVQDYYGDLEACWSGSNAFVPESGFDPGSVIAPVFEASETSEFGRMSDPNGRKPRDYYGYLVEIDTTVPTTQTYQSIANGGDGSGNRKLGVMGRARWENAVFAVGRDWELVDGQPVVVYASDDRRSGRIYKFVSSQPYTAGMSVGEARALLDEGTLYVSHFAGLDVDTGMTISGETPTEENRGQGQWIDLSLDSQDVAPNAEALGQPETTVGEALQDVEWNGIGGFATENDVLLALFTASNKIGVAELNRPEDIEWNPADLSGTPRLYVAFTNHTAQVALDQNGVLFDPATHSDTSPRRADRYGSIFTMIEADPANPGSSTTFTYFAAWLGTSGKGAFNVANPDNLMIDRDGGVWFGTDGNFGRNGTADALYYLDLDPAHKETATPTYGMPFRVVAGPSDSEATGPAFSSDMGTIFFNVQHPGESVYSTWPQGR